MVEIPNIMIILWSIKKIEGKSVILGKMLSEFFNIPPVFKSLILM